MKQALLYPVLVLVCLLPSLASEPGQPFAVEDWEMIDPGLSAQLWAVRAEDCDSNPSKLDCRFGESHGSEDKIGDFIDAAGQLWIVEYQDVAPFPWDPGDIIGYWVFLRCVSPTECHAAARFPATRFVEYTQYWEVDESEVLAIWIDTVGGKLYVRLETRYLFDIRYNPGEETHVIQGLPTVLEIQQTFVPASQGMGFRVPYMPEGLDGAHYFDTYYGDLATVGDWGQAQPLQCGYPGTSPAVGQYLAVADTLPAPAPGQGYYYVTAVNFLGERRYGRECVNGVLSGRDPALLPTCGSSAD